jgi:hypothetical protein
VAHAAARSAERSSNDTGALTDHAPMAWDQQMTDPDSAPKAGDRHRALKIALAISGSFTALVALIVLLLVMGKITFQLALLMLVAMLGLYVGIGVLIAVYRFIETLE